MDSPPLNGSLLGIQPGLGASATLAGGCKRSLLETPFLPLKRVKLSLSPDNPLRDALTAA